MDDFTFMTKALDIGLALNQDRAQENWLRSRGQDDKANAIYARNKEAARVIFDKLGMSAAEFDKRFAQLAKKHRVRVNVKLERLFS